MNINFSSSPMEIKPGLQILSISISLPAFAVPLVTSERDLPSPMIPKVASLKDRSSEALLRGGLRASGTVKLSILNLSLVFDFVILLSFSSSLINANAPITSSSILFSSTVLKLWIVTLPPAESTPPIASSEENTLKLSL